MTRQPDRLPSGDGDQVQSDPGAKRHLLAYDGCVICGSRRFAVLADPEQLERERHYRDQLFVRYAEPGTPDYMFEDLTIFTNDYPARLVQCDPCGLITRDPRFTATASIEAYAKDDYHPQWLETTFEEYRGAFRSEMPRLIKKVGPLARVLEVGSYVGGFLAAAREFGWQAEGVDVGQRVSEFVRFKGLRVRTGTLVDAGFPAQSFEAACVWVCFDQLPDPWEVLAEIRRVLVPGGWLFLRVPNGEFMKWAEPLARLVPSNAWQEAILKTLAFTGLAGFHFQMGYTPASLRRILGASGFGSIDIRNRINLPDSQDQKPFAVSEQGTYLARVQRASEIVTRLSFGLMVKGPWIQVSCRKA
jgi:SAM-dependent methyltransferase